MIKKTWRLLRLFIIGFMLAICIVMGVAVVIPKRKDQAGIETEIQDKEQKNDTTAVIEVTEIRE